MKVVRIIIVFILVGAFSYLAYNLYTKQKNKYSFLSFELEAHQNSIVVPNINRLLEKISSSTQIEGLGINTTLTNGCNKLLKHKNYDFNAAVGEACFMSFNEIDFHVAFSNPDFNFEEVVAILNDVLNVPASFSENKLSINGQQYETGQYGLYTVIGTLPIQPVHAKAMYTATNADFFILKDTVQIDRYILANNKQFKVWNESATTVRGKPINHSDFVKMLPASSEVAYFYGSTRFMEDKNSFFSEPGEEEFSWVDQGLMIFKKGGYELMIAKQNDQRDLKLILEEHTLKAKGDTIQIQFVNVKNFEIMPFETAFNWTKSIPTLNTTLAFYTEFDNFNILANSMAAMQWYLAEMQTGNLMEDNADRFEHYSLSAPFKTHFVHFENQQDDILVETGTWTEKTKCTKTFTNATLIEGEITPAAEGVNFSVQITPKNIQPFVRESKRKLLLSNDEQLVCYSMDGELEWEYKLEGSLLFAPEFIDLENDGASEIAVFSNNAFTVLNGDGKVVGALNRKFANPISGGLCVNYDLKYDYRFFVVSGPQVTCLNEQGQVVPGWKFVNANMQLSGEASYTQIAGIDFLTFKAVNDNVFVLNRRGEPRFGDAVQSKLSNESEFVTGKDENLLHKLGYSNQYIYNRYLKDGYTDSVKLDKRVNSIAARWVLLDEPALLIEEPNRIVLFNQFGYLKQEILKPQDAQTFLGIESTPEIHYVFFNNSNNSLYLLNGDGKIVLSNLVNSTEIYGIDQKLFYTFDGHNIEAHKLN